VRALNGPHAPFVRCPPRGRSSALRTAVRALNGPHAHFVRCPAEDVRCAAVSFTGPGGN